MPVNKTYTGKYFKLSIGGTLFGVADGEISLSREAAVQERAGYESDLELPGKLKLDSFRFTSLYVKGELWAKLIGGSVATGPVSDVTLKSGITPPGAGNESIGDMSVTNSQKGIIKAVVKTAAVTGAGWILVEGTDVNDQPIQGRIDIPAGAGIGTEWYMPDRKVFKTVTHYEAHEWVQAGGTVDLVACAKASSVVPGRPPFFTVDAYVTDGTDSFHVVANNCWISKGTLPVGSASKPVNQPIEVRIRDLDADLSITYVETVDGVAG